MVKHLVFAFGLFLSVQLSSAGNSGANAFSKDCIIPIGSKSKYLAQWPLVFDKKAELYATSYDDVSGESFIKVKSGEEVILSCGPNYFKNYFKVEAQIAMCNGATGNFTVNGSEEDATELTCDLRVIEEVLDDVNGCFDSKLTAARFGYVDPNKKKTILLGEVCYDMPAGKTNFVHFKLGDKASSHLEILPKNYLTSLKHPDGRYKIELFRGLHFDELYDRIRSTLNVPHNPNFKMNHFVDEILLSSPQLQAIKKLGWNYFVSYDENDTLELIKRDIKRLSETSNLDIYIGSHGVKHLHGDNGEEMALFLHDAQKRFPVPRVVWLIVKQGEKATVFGVRNDDDSNRLMVQSGASQDNERICKNNDCSKVTWLSAELKRDNKLICCDVNDIRRTIQNIPIIPGVDKMLL